MNIAPRVSACQRRALHESLPPRERRIAASRVADPVSAARRLLGAVITCRGVSAPDRRGRGLRRPARRPVAGCGVAFLSGDRACAMRVMFGPAGSALHLSQPRHPRVRQRRVRPDGTAAAVLLRAAAIESGIDAAQARRGPAVRPVALARGPGNLCSALAITMDDNGVDLFDAACPVDCAARRSAAGQLRPAGRGEPGRRSAVAVLAHRTSGGVGVSAQSTRAGAGRERLRSPDAGRSIHEHDDSRRVGLARTDRAVHRHRRARRRGGRSDR